jgi:hypothetical protein
VHTKFRSKNRRGVDYSEDLVLDNRIMFERILEKYGENV